MTTPLISVIVPNYNYAVFLEERLTSILGQTYQNIEVLLLDDCSSDHSVEVLQRFAQSDKRVRELVVSPTNSGSPYHQWSKGIQMAKGKYIWIAEADDVADCTLLEKAVAAFERYPQAVLVQVDSLLIDDAGQTLKKDIDHWKRNHITPNSIELVHGEQYIRKHMYWKNRIYNASGVVVRKDCITPDVLGTLVIPHISDWVFWSAIAIQGDIVQVHERLNRFRQHTSSLTHSETAHIQGAHNEAQVVRMLQQMVHIPYILRLRRIRKICSRYHVMKQAQCWTTLKDIVKQVLYPNTTAL